MVSLMKRPHLFLPAQKMEGIIMSILVQDTMNPIRSCSGTVSKLSPRNEAAGKACGQVAAQLFGRI